MSILWQIVIWAVLGLLMGLMDNVGSIRKVKGENFLGIIGGLVGAVGAGLFIVTYLGQGGHVIITPMIDRVLDYLIVPLGGAYAFIGTLKSFSPYLPMERL